jgi:hypothetical protein
MPISTSLPRKGERLILYSHRISGSRVVVLKLCQTATQKTLSSVRGEHRVIFARARYRVAARRLRNIVLQYPIQETNNLK